MPAWFELTLDTSAPLITFGEPSGASASQTLVVPFTAGEVPTSLTASLRNPQGVFFTVDVVGSEFRIDLPADYVGGTSRLIAISTDDVGNTRENTLDILITGVASSPEVGSGGGIGIYGPLGQRFTKTVPVSVDLARQREFLLRVGTGLRKANQPVSFAVQADASLAKSVEFSIHGVWESSLHMSRIRTEEEILLLLID